MEITPNFKLWMEIGGKPILGEGRADLLKEIDKCGSLSQAARNLEISYRHAHNLIGNLNKRCGFKVIESSIGGSKGGGMKLTKIGKQLLEDYLLLKENIYDILNKYQPTTSDES